MSLLSEAAVAYLAGGHRLLALKGKRPHPQYHGEWSWDNSIHGMPSEPEHLTALYACLDDPTVTGLAILIPPHVLVADIDTEEAAALFNDLAGIPADTARGLTKNGLHVWYLAPGEAASRWLGGRTLLFKGYGGYVAVEPSQHFDEHGVFDGSYSWVSPLEDGIDWLPEGIAEMLKADALRDAMKPTQGEGDMVEWQLQFDADGSWESAYPTYAMDGLAHTIENAADGNQNNVIHWAACVARDGGVPFEVSMKTLLAAALKGNHPRDRAVSTIRGAYRKSRG